MRHTTSDARVRHYAFATVASIVALVVTLVVDDPLVEPNTLLLFLAAVMCSSWYGGIGPGLVATVFTGCAAMLFSLAPAFMVSEQSALRLLEFVAVCVLISCLNEARRRSQDRAERACAEAAAAQRIKDEFLARVSHDLRTPLSAILGWTEIIHLEGADQATREHALAVIKRSTLTEVRLVEDLLDVSRTLTGQLRLRTRPLDLNVVLQGAIDVLNPAMEAKALKLRTEVHITGLVLGDAERLQQVLWNLLSNAVKFTPAKGVVTVAIEERDGRARVTVNDTGPGIDAAALPHIFEPFYQGKIEGTRDAGLGLGLVIARHVAELHGGTLRAEKTESGSGARFVLELPTMEEQPAHSFNRSFMGGLLAPTPSHSRSPGV